VVDVRIAGVRLFGVLSMVYAGRAEMVVFEPACQLGIRTCFIGIVERRLVNIVYVLRRLRRFNSEIDAVIAMPAEYSQVSTAFGVGTDVEL